MRKQLAALCLALFVSFGLLQPSSDWISEVVDWFVDAIPIGLLAVPDTTITSGPSDGSTAASPVNFSFSGAPSDGFYQCKMDSASFSRCTSPKGYTLSNGAHSFQVRALAANGTADKTPATRSFTIGATGGTPVTDTFGDTVGTSGATVDAMADTDDGRVQKLSTAYPPTGTVGRDMTGTTIVPARNFATPNYTVRNGIVKWNTSSIPDSNTVTSAKLKIRVTGKGSMVGDLWGECYVFDGTDADYTATPSSSAFTATPASLSTSVSNEITISNPATCVNKTGSTGIRLHMQDRGTPTANDQVTIASVEGDNATNNAHEPQLVVTHEPPAPPSGDAPISGLGTMSVAAGTLPVDDSGNAIDAASDCTHRIQRGSNDNTTVTGTGTSADPWVGRDAWKNLVTATDAGEILCVDGPAGGNGNGVYDVNGPITGNGLDTDTGEYMASIGTGDSGTGESNRTIYTSTPGTGRAELVGGILVNDGINFFTIHGLKVDGSGATTSTGVNNQGRINNFAPIRWRGDNGKLLDNELYHSRHRSAAEDALPSAPNLAVCLQLGAGSSQTANNTQITGNWIHNCGVFADFFDSGQETVNGNTWTGNADNHCFYPSAAVTFTFQNNLLHDCAESGINFYPNPDSATIQNNIIVRGGPNTLLHSASSSPAGANNVLQNNVFAYPRDGVNINRSSGSGTLTDNCFWLYSGSGSGTTTTGWTVTGSVTADPGFTNIPANTTAGSDDMTDNYTMTSGTCKDKLTVAQTTSPDP
jgi:hypothetical protein